MDSPMRFHLQQLKARLANMKRSQYAKNYVEEIRRFCQVRHLKPQRQLNLSPEEEADRCKKTWQMFDHCMHSMCFADRDTLQEMVLDPEALQRDIQSCVIGFSDQVPWWGMVQQEKQLYLAAEVGKNAGQMKQLRGHDDDIASKFRVTLELRQLVLNWFSADQDPVDMLGKSLLVVAGVRCRLSNIDGEGRWVQDETFKVGGEVVSRQKGHSARGAMASWVKLRSERPELFQRVDVMQQPAAVMDAVLFKWVLESQAKQFPCSLWMRDLSGGGGFAVQSARLMSVAQQVPAWIMGKMTSVLQVTDTDMARPLKQCANDAKQELRQELKAAAVQTGVGESFKCGPAEILRVIDTALQKLERRLAGKKPVLAAAVRNGILAYRPNWSTRKLEPFAEQKWFKDGVGLKDAAGKQVELCKSHRLNPAWSTDRLQWRDSEGVPVKPEWGPKGLEQYMDDSAVAHPHETQVHMDDAGKIDVKGPQSKVNGQLYEETQFCLGGFADWDATVKEDVLAAVQKQMSVRNRMMETQLHNAVTAQGREADQEKKQASKTITKKQNAALKKAMLQKALKQDVRDMKDHKRSPAEIMHSIVAEVQQKTKRKVGIATAAAKKKAVAPKMKAKVKKAIKLGALKLSGALLKATKAKGGKLCPF